MRKYCMVFIQINVKTDDIEVNLGEISKSKSHKIG